jgi:glycolate dehydrogenase FAD-binding subunit
VSALDLNHMLAPGTYEEATGFMRELDSTGTQVRFRGGGTKLEWGRPTRVGHVLSTEGLDRVIEHNVGDFTAVIQAGMRLTDLQGILGQEDQRLSLDPPTGDSDAATIGGIVSSGDAGPLRHRYGSPRDLILGVTVALPGGSVAKSGGKVIKNVAGYDLGKLYAGSFGTLGLILQLALRLHPVPQRPVTSVGHSRDPDQVASAVHSLARTPLEPEALDVRWREGVGTVLIRLAGSAAEALANRARSLMADAGLRTEATSDDEDHWRTQRQGQRAREGVAVRVSGTASQLPEVLRAAEARGASLVGRAAHGVSWLVLEPASDSHLAEAVESLRRELAPSPCVVLDAPESLRERFDVWGLEGAAERRLMTAVKERFDPERRCNPGLYGESI